MNTIEAGDSDWVIVEHKELPTLPTYPGGGRSILFVFIWIVELVKDWMPFYFHEQYYEGDGDARGADEANMASRHAKLARFLERQLRAYRILALTECDFRLLCDDVGLEPKYLCYDETQDARVYAVESSLSYNMKQLEPMPLLAPMAMITGPDWSRRHIIASVIEHFVYVVAQLEKKAPVAEVQIKNFKSNFISVIAGVDPDFPVHLWDKLLPGAEIQFNLLRQSNMTPTVSSYAHLFGPFDYDRMPLGPLGYAVNPSLTPTRAATASPPPSISGTSASPARKSASDFMIVLLSRTLKRQGRQRRLLTQPRIAPSDQISQALPCPRRFASAPGPRRGRAADRRPPP
ncbi:hypothetical protein THAOC_17790 [Thalassiosira oceanica]|uniref:Uncharacterized protein n=1 Tax=Thalassiosira oceanica TaxID=159749 RepID=K0S8V2_THAOC|nr:hypothetical protein THAOC_17790 [Thalassiosira oceanica]|eukprot:EJK61680.1 hypothetical protein THAOC_17790 [Thalassiosira oceanica]